MADGELHPTGYKRTIWLYCGTLLIVAAPRNARGCRRDSKYHDDGDAPLLCSSFPFGIDLVGAGASYVPSKSGEDLRPLWLQDINDGSTEDCSQVCAGKARALPLLMSLSIGHTHTADPIYILASLNTG